MRDPFGGIVDSLPRHGLRRSHCAVLVRGRTKLHWLHLKLPTALVSWNQWHDCCKAVDKAVRLCGLGTLAGTGPSFARSVAVITAAAALLKMAVACVIGRL